MCDMVYHYGVDLHFPDDCGCWASFYMPVGHVSVLCSIIYNNKDGHKVPINRKVDKKEVVHTCMDYSSAIKKRNHVICDNTHGPRGCCAKWNKSDRKRKTLTLWFHPMKQNKNRFIDAESKLVVARWKGVGVIGEKRWKELRSTISYKNNHRDVKHSIGNIVKYSQL